MDNDKQGYIPRRLTAHIVNPCNDKIQIDVMDAPGSGGAHHEYCCAWANKENINAAPHHVIISFQNGPIAEAGTNGVTHEALLAILIDRLQCFQKGPYAGRENALALTKLEEAMHWLNHRTRERMARGVEGTHKK